MMKKTLKQLIFCQSSSLKLFSLEEEKKCKNLKFMGLSKRQNIMGLFNLVDQLLPNSFSIYQFMAILDMEKEDAREARNILKQFYQRGYIQRLSKNMYLKKNPTPKVVEKTNE
jgi:hypothetical protein